MTLEFGNMKQVKKMKWEFEKELVRKMLNVLEDKFDLLLNAKELPFEGTCSWIEEQLNQFVWSQGYEKLKRLSYEEVESQLVYMRERGDSKQVTFVDVRTAREQAMFAARNSGLARTIDIFIDNLCIISIVVKIDVARKPEIRLVYHKRVIAYLIKLKCMKKRTERLAMRLRNAHDAVVAKKL